MSRCLGKWRMETGEIITSFSTAVSQTLLFFSKIFIQIVFRSCSSSLPHLYPPVNLTPRGHQFMFLAFSLRTSLAVFPLPRRNTWYPHYLKNKFNLAHGLRYWVHGGLAASRSILTRARCSRYTYFLLARKQSREVVPEEGAGDKTQTQRWFSMTHLGTRRSVLTNSMVAPKPIKLNQSS